jgi:deoxyadenosine/deoxycytidine kinase
MIISIEGNIGSGKSTFVHIFKEFCKDISNIVFLQEPVDKWLALKDTDGENILEKFYKDQKRWSYSFQMNAFITRSKEIMANDVNTNIIIMERSVLTDRNVFATLLYESGNISEMEWKLYNEWYHWLTKEFTIRPQLYIYLKADYNISYERMKKRSRVEEDIVPLEYIKKVSEKHDSWLLNNPDCLVINVDEDFEHNISNKEYITKLMAKILVDLGTRGVKSIKN